MNQAGKIKRYAVIAVFAAMAYIVTLVFRIHVMFLTFDAKDAVITVASLFFGPTAGVMISLIAALLELTVSGTGLYGFIMNFASSAVFSAVAALIYRRRHTMGGAVFSLACAVISMSLVMIALNLVITPFYMGVPKSEVVPLLGSLILPFNLLKGTLNASLTAILYKPMATAIRAVRIVDAPVPTGRNGRRSVVVTACAIVVAAACILIFILVLKGNFKAFG